MYGTYYRNPKPKAEGKTDWPAGWLRASLDMHQTMTIRADAMKRAGYPHAADCAENVAAELLKLIEALDKVKE